jgi:hypothetical protein
MSGSPRNESKIRRNKSQAGRNRIEARRNKNQIRRNKIQMPLPTTNRGFSMGYHRFQGRRAACDGISCLCFVWFGLLRPGDDRTVSE